MIIYDLIFLSCLLLTILYYYKRKDLLSPGQVIFIFIIFNIYLYFKGYSDFININNLDFSFYLIIISILIMFFLLTILTKKVNISKDDVIYKLKRPVLLYLINILNIVLVLVENVVGSGTLIPTLHGIDIHTFSMPIISLFTRSMGFLLILNYIHYVSSKKKTFILLSILVVIFPIITRASRMISVVGLVQFLVFYLIVNKQKVHNNIKNIIKFALVTVVIVILFSSIAQYRMHNFNNESDSYASSILYNGYEDGLGILPMYYGYFAMPYDNLSLSMENVKIQNDVHTFGAYTFSPIFWGVFFFDNLFEDFPDRAYAKSIRLWNVPQATVPTGFYEFYLDFGDFAFFSIMMYGFITLLFYNRIKNNVFNASYYSILAGAWALMSFQNVLIEVITLYNILFLFIFGRFLLTKTNTR